MRLLPVNPITLARCKRLLVDNRATLEVILLQLPTWSGLTDDERQVRVASYQSQLANTNHDIAAIDTVFAADDAAVDPRDALLLEAAQQIGHLRSELAKTQTSLADALSKR